MREWIGLRKQKESIHGGDILSIILLSFSAYTDPCAFFSTQFNIYLFQVYFPWAPMDSALWTFWTYEQVKPVNLAFPTGFMYLSVI